MPRPIGTGLTHSVAPPLPAQPAALGLRRVLEKPASGMLGHFSAGFTLDTYAHVTGAAQRQAAQTMAGVLGGG